MQGWQTTYLGIRELPREISAFELQTFFTFSTDERKLIEARRVNALKLGLALHIGFLRMSGRLLNTFRVVPPSLWHHLGAQFGVPAPEIASLRAMYGRDRTLFDHQQVTCEGLGFLRYCLLTSTDQLIMMIQRRVADLWRRTYAGIGGTVNWAVLYQTLLGDVAGLSAEGTVPDAELRTHLCRR